MKDKSSKAHAPKRGKALDFENMASSIAMEVWNELAHLPKMRNLQPHDFPGVYEVICRSLKHYRHHAW